MSLNLRYLCLLAYNDVHHIVSLICFSSSCVPYVASFSLDGHFVIAPLVFHSVYLEILPA